MVIGEADYIRYYGMLSDAFVCPGFQPVKDTTPVIVWYNNGVMSRYIRPAKAWRFWTGGRDWWQKPIEDDRLYIARYAVAPLNITQQGEMMVQYHTLFSGIK